MIRYDAFTKEYDGHRAVDALTFEVPPGSIVALLGPNGSGKTTTIKAAAGLIRPTSGRVLLGTPGRPATEAAARVTCSFLPQRVAFPEALTGREVVEFYRRLRGAPADATSRVLKFASLNGAGSRAVGTYSGGMLQRLGLAVAMLPEAPVLLLDEPTAALDPDGLCALYGLLEARQRAGGAVLFSSHQMGDVERLADHVAVLADGRLRAVLTEREVADRLADRGVMRVRLAEQVPGLLARVRQIAPQALWFDTELIVPGPASARPAVLDVIRNAGGDVRGLTAEEGRLDAFYRELLGPDDAGAPAAGGGAS
ncbi:MAG: ABC transporter ATP-binding protein [Acidobacteriota bacterium]